MPEVFSIYNCGTSHNRQNLDETVANLAQRTSGAENRDWMINDGPGSWCHSVSGSASMADRSLAAQAKTPGTRDPVSGFKEDSWFAAARGVVDGYGWEQNVSHTMAVLNATIDLPRTVNIVGWSRGAITCFMVAHALHKNSRTRGIDVNIFAFDPVPGPGNFNDPDKVSLPPNVRRYAAVVQEDERRKIFKPVLINANDAPGFKTKFYYMPGGHSSGVFRTKTEVGLIAAFLAHRFLQKHCMRRFGLISRSIDRRAEVFWSYLAGNVERSRTDFWIRATLSMTTMPASFGKPSRKSGRRWIAALVLGVKASLTAL